MNNDVQVNNAMSVNKPRPLGKSRCLRAAKKPSEKPCVGKGSIPAPGPRLTRSDVTHSRPSIKVHWMKRSSATETKTQLYKQHHLDENILFTGKEEQTKGKRTKPAQT